MSEVSPELFGNGCNHQLPAWGVTRQFDFGQFVILYDERTVNGKRVVTPVVLSDEGDIVIPDEETSRFSPGLKHPATTVTGGVPLHLLYESDRAIELINSRRPVNVAIDDVADFLRSGSVTIDDRKYATSLPTDARIRLGAGQPVTVISRVSREGQEGQHTLIRLVPRILELEVGIDEVNKVLASGELVVDRQTKKTKVTSHVADALLKGQDVVVSISHDAKGAELVRLVQKRQARPLSARYRISDLAHFIANPSLKSTNGYSIAAELTPTAVEKLRTEGRATVRAGGVDVELVVSPIPTTELGEDGMRRALLSGPGGNFGLTVDPTDLGGWSPSAQLLPEEWAPPINLVPEDLKPSLELPPAGARPVGPSKGLQLAVLLPWRQQWELKGFSRGSLLSTIALAPGEETTITIASWERRAKALEQSTETEVEQQVDFTQTTRDTEDVFRELTNRHDFQSQFQGQFDASYSTGVGSVRIGSSGGVTNTDSLQSICRTTQQHMREATTRASTRVRSKRITKITETVERTYSQEVIRRIRNPNQCHTLTLDFHEVLAHYTIGTKFVIDRVRVVVLIPNPISISGFTQLLVRKSETALRNALLDSALVDGFEACRLLASYEYAKADLQAAIAEGKKMAELDRERVVDIQSTKKKPTNPHKIRLLELIGEIKTIGQALSGASNGLQEAVDAIANDRSLTADERKNGQRAMFVCLCKAKISPSFIDSLFALAVQSTNPTISDAQNVIDVVPGLGAFPSLATLNDLPDIDKEQAGLENIIKSHHEFSLAKWAWFTGRCREEGVYRPDDAGLAAKCDRLREAWRDYQAKEAEGDAIQEGAQLAQTAQSSQTAANYLDKLEMKFGLETIANARERVEALLGHLNDHLDYYRYVLFQSLPPGEQLRRLMDVAPQLRVGMFEPHVVAMNGPLLAVPLTPLGETKLAKTLTMLKDILKTASDEASEAEEAMSDNQVILPTPGVSVESWLGRCSGCEEHLEKLREAEVRRAVAGAESAEHEAARLSARLKASQLDDPVGDKTPLFRVRVDNNSDR
jgi:hypothetical protein